MKWEEEKAFSFNEVGLQTSIAWMPFQPKSLHEELTVTLSSSKPQWKSLPVRYWYNFICYATSRTSV